MKFVHCADVHIGMEFALNRLRSKQRKAEILQSFLRVTLPYSLPGVLEGITMVFVPAVTTFVISQLMGGGKVPLIGDIIQNQFGKSSDWHFGSTLSLLVMVVVLAFMGGLQRIDKEEEPQKEVRIL